MPKKCFYLVDAHAFLHKSYHALPKLTTSKGEEVGALFGFSKLLFGILRDRKADYIAVCFDSKGGSFRNNIYDLYKANRPPIDENLLKQLIIAREITDAMGLVPVFKEQYEADDLIATLATAAENQGYETVIVSADKDISCLINDNIKMWDGSSKELRDEKFVFEKYGVAPKLMPDYLSLLGDASDNIPGVAGIGAKSAAKLINAYGGLKNIFQISSDDALVKSDKLLTKVFNNIDMAKLSYQLVALQKDVDIDTNVENYYPRGFNSENFNAMAARLEFKFLQNAEIGLNDIKVPMPELSPLNDVLNTGADLYLALINETLIISSSDKACIINQINESDKNLILSSLENNSVKKNIFSLKDVLHFLDAPLNFTAKNYFDAQTALLLTSFDRKKLSLPDLLADLFSSQKKEDPAEEALYCASMMPALCGKLNSDINSAGEDSVYYDMELPLINTVYAMEKRGIKVNREFLSELSKKYQGRIEQLQKDVIELTGGEVNLNSPKQLSFLIYAKINMGLSEEWKKQFKTKDGFSTSEEALLSLKDSHPIIPIVLEHRELSKLKSSFTDPLYEASAADGRVHCVFEQLGTATGRFSSSKPNLQNIPVRSEAGLEVRGCFEATEGYTLLSADYSQIDLRVLAHLSGDKNFTEAFNNGEDIHLRTASEIFNFAPQMITPEMRRSAKAINFGIVYGQTAQGLSNELGITRAEAMRYIKHYFEVCPGVKIWSDITKENAKKTGYVTTFTGRKRKISELSSTNMHVRAFGERAAINTPVQGGSADIIKKAMNDIAKEMYNRKDVYMLLQVHDELIFEVKKEKLAETAVMVKEKMENAYKLNVPLLVELKAGDNWRAMKKYEQ